jgi:sugar/nucleoside kinase (ribokinase family)
MSELSKNTISFDFLALGEAVVDFISKEVVAHLVDASSFERFTGGQVTNLAMNMARLGNRVALGACLGDDGFGELLQQRIAAANICTDYLQITREAPTTLIPVTRTPRGTPEFVICRGADARLQAEDQLLEAAAHTKILHTSAFALSREPARSTILQAMQIARQHGKRVSLDPNYHPRIWPDTPQFLDLLKKAFQYVSVTKPSLDDCVRLLGSGLRPQQYAARFLEWGAELVVISMGSEGVYLASQEGNSYQIIPQEIIPVDVTGAGDAFWSGLLTALLDELPVLDAVRVGQIVAQIKVCTLGPLSESLDRQSIYAQAQAVQYRQVSSKS